MSQYILRLNIKNSSSNNKRLLFLKGVRESAFCNICIEKQPLLSVAQNKCFEYVVQILDNQLCRSSLFSKAAD